MTFALVLNFKKDKMKLIVIATLWLSFLIFQNINAQDSNTIQRKGFVFGTSLGTASTFLKFPDKQQTDIGIALDLKVGYMLNPKLALLLSTNVSVYDYSGYGRDRKRDFGILAPSIQYWLKDRFWVLGGIGLGGDNPVFWDIHNPDTNPLEIKYFNGFGIITAFGYELYHRKNLTFDIKAKVSYRKVNLHEGNTSGISSGILLGINFY